MHKILLIDDNLSLTTLLSRALDRFGYEAYSENNSVNAMNSIRSINPDLIVLDLMMPGKNGVEIYSELMADKVNSQTPVIMLTALAEHSEFDLDAFDCDVMQKPAKLDELRDRIEKKLSNRHSAAA